MSIVGRDDMRRVHDFRDGHKEDKIPNYTDDVVDKTRKCTKGQIVIWRVKYSSVMRNKILDGCFLNTPHDHIPSPDTIVLMYSNPQRIVTGTFQIL